MIFYDFPVFCVVVNRMRDKTTDFRVGQKSWFWKRDKIADSDNEIKTDDFKVGQNRKTADLQ